ncbi:unnamed protein product [Symbiodinium sp. CCMP2456]|nr:unnamed protein product [Symbiodinium sp. CCMP2456]
MAEVNSREALLQAGVSQAQVEDVLRNLQSQQLVLAPAPDPQKSFSTALWREEFSPLSKGQLEEMKRVCSLSESDFDALSDILERSYRFHRRLGIGMMACMFVTGLSAILLLLSGRAFERGGDPPPSYVGAVTSAVVCLCLVFVHECALPRSNRQIASDLNQHFRGHASNLSFQIAVTDTNCCMEKGWRLVVCFEARADGSV